MSWPRRAPRPDQARVSAAALALVGALLCLAPTARAQDRTPSERHPVVCTASPDGGVTCDLDLRSFFDAEVERKLKSGFLNRFLYRVYIRRASDGEPVAFWGQRLLEVYELWDEVYYVFTEEGGPVTHKTPRLEDALGPLTRFNDLPMAQALPPGRYYADVFVDVNPLSPAEEAELRKWLARSRGGHRTFATGDRSFFGTFVSLFINIRPNNAERTFRVQTAPFTVVAP